MQLLNHSALLNMLGWSLFNSLWQMSLMWLLYFIITNGGKNFSATVKHSIALILLSIGSVWFFISLATNYFDHHFSGRLIIASHIFSDKDPSFLISAKHLTNYSLPYIALAYMLAIVFLMMRYFKNYFSTQHLKQTGLQKAPAELKFFIENISATLPIKKKISVWLSSAIQSPMTIGFLKPVILIPLATINHLSTQQMEAVLLHELAHIKRNDYLVNLMAALIETVFFFNPFALLLVQSIKKERENSCDDMVLQFQYDPCAYASALLSLEKTRQNYPDLAMAAVGKSNKLLLQRVKRITNQKSIDNKNPRFIFFALFALISFFAALIPQQNHIAKFVQDKNHGLQSIKPLKSRQINYTTIFFVNKKKEKVLFNPKERVDVNNIKKDKPDNEPVFELFANNNLGNEVDAGNIIQGAAAEPVEYSITLPEKPAPPANISLNNYPFVPSTSFSYKEIEDTAVPKLLPVDAEKEAKLSMEKASEAISKIDLKKIEREIKTNNRDLDIAKLQNEILKSLRDLDWDEINPGQASALDEANEKRMRNDLQVQLQALQNIQYKDLQKAQQLQQKIIRQQLKLQQAAIKKQRGLMRQAEEIKRKIKVVYI